MIASATWSFVLANNSGTTLTGRVLTPEGKPAAGAYVGVVVLRSNSKLKAQTQAVTDQDGNYRISLPDSQPPTYVARAYLAGYGVPPEALTSTTHLTIRLANSERTTVRVVDAVGQPVRSLWIGSYELAGRELPDKFRLHLARPTDRLGEVSFDYVPVGESSAFEACDRGVTLREIATTTQGLRQFVAEQEAKIVGTLKLNDQPVPNVYIACQAGSPKRSLPGRTDEHGHFEINHVPPGCIKLDAIGSTRSTPFPDARLDLTAKQGETKTVQWDLSAPG